MVLLNFRSYADKLNAKDGKAGGDSWHRWFILPYVQRPESDPFFRVRLPLLHQLVNRKACIHSLSFCTTAALL
jgi:hypothetical protein